MEIRGEKGNSSPEVVGVIRMSELHKLVLELGVLVVAHQILKHRARKPVREGEGGSASHGWGEGP